MNEYGAMVDESDRENPSTRKKNHIQLPLCPPKILPHELAWDGTWASAAIHRLSHGMVFISGSYPSSETYNKMYN